MEIDPSSFSDQSWKAVVATARPEEVRKYLIDEVFRALGVRADSLWRAWFGPLFTPMVNGIARKASAFDECVSREGLKSAAQEWLKKWIPGLQTVGGENLPEQGPLLIAANHPGTFDSLAVASVVPRQDLHVVAAGSPIFRALPNLRQYLIYATSDTQVRTVTLRNAIRHLQGGGALLIFPNGTLEPDPRHFKQAARRTLSHWSASIRLMASKVPQVKLVLAINSGFVDRSYLQNPLTHLRKSIEGRQRLAEFFQVVQHLLYDRKIHNQPSIVFSEPLSFSTKDSSPEEIQAQIVETACCLLDATPSG